MTYTREEIINRLNDFVMGWEKPKSATADFWKAVIQALSQEPICDRDCEHCTWTECPIEPCDDAEQIDYHDDFETASRKIHDYEERQKQNDKRCGNCKLIGTEICYMVCGGSKSHYKPKQKIEPCDVFDEYGNYKYPSDVELTEPNTATSMPCDAISRDFQIGDEVRIIGSDPIYDDCDVGWVIRNASEKIKTMYVMRNDGSAGEEAKAEWYKTGRHNAVLAEVIKALPSVTQSGKWDRLYSWLNDMRLGIAPDETVYDDMERMSRKSQVDIIDEIMEWIEKHTNCGARMESGDKE